MCAILNLWPKTVALWCLLGALDIRAMHANTVGAHHNMQEYRTVEQIQQQNVEVLSEALMQGWRAFCDAPVDEGVMSLHQGINPSDATLHLMTVNNQSIQLPIKALGELRDFDISPQRKTVIYVNAFCTSDSIFSVQAHLELFQVTRRDLNVIVVDFAKNIDQLYYAIRHHLAVQGYFIYKILKALLYSGIHTEDITLVGHSVGANIAALGAKLFLESRKQLIAQMIAIDPAIMCRPTEIFVNTNVAERVIVLHGEGDVFGVRMPLGHIDIYPNGIGYFPRRKLQPGCETKLCSHMYPFVLFMEAIVEGVMIPAAKCDSWAKFKQRECDYANTLAIGLSYPRNAHGLYFCLTQPNPPFTYMEHGLTYKDKKKNM